MVVCSIRNLLLWLYAIALVCSGWSMQAVSITQHVCDLLHVTLDEKDDYFVAVSVLFII